MVITRLKISNALNVVKIVAVIAAISAGVLLMIFFGFPLIEDLIKGVDPSLRYQPRVEKNFALNTGKTAIEKPEPYEMYLPTEKFKNDPYIDGDRIIFTTRIDGSEGVGLDSVIIYNTKTGESDPLPNVKKKYDNLLSPVLSGNTAVWIDSMKDGGGRIVGYDLAKNKQFLIKEYAYAIPKLSISGDLLTFMQWAGENVQRLYLYNVSTREAATVRLYETEVGNSAADISPADLVWSEYHTSDGAVTGQIKRIVFENGGYRYAKTDFGMNVFEPKTNGKDIVFATEYNTMDGALMLSAGGGTPTKIADNVTNYDLGDGFVAYTKDGGVYICYTGQQKTEDLTSQITKNLLVCANGNGMTYYDVTDGVPLEEVVKYAHVG